MTKKKYLASLGAAVLAAFSIWEMPKLQFDALAKDSLKGVRNMSIPLTSKLQSFIRSQFSMMHRLLIPLALMLALFVAMPVSSANYQHGMDAYNKEDYATAFEQWRALAEQGDIDAQYSLGYLYYYGKGVPQENKIAVMWYTLAAKQGKVGAQYNLGDMYYTGEGVPQDYKIAVKWYTLAAEQGNCDAQYSLGDMYYYGKGVSQGYKTAFKWFTLAAQQWNTDAQAQLAAMYGNGEGTLQNYVRAHMWINIASSRGFSSDYRDKLAEKMTPQQVEKAQKFALEWVEKHGS